MIENLNDVDFREMYADEFVDPQANTHLEILCEKFFLLLDYAKRDSDYEENVLYYFYKYYAYEENGVLVNAILLNI